MWVENRSESGCPSQEQKYEVNGGRFCPLLSTKMDSAFCQDLGKTAVAKLGSGSYVQKLFLSCLCSPESALVPPTGLSSQELHFHLRVLNMNKKPIEYLK